MLQPTIFFIHGWAANARVWQDAYGTDRSLYYDAPHFPDFIHLHETFGSITSRDKTPLILVGWSLGGMLAMQLAALHPDRIGKLILISSTPRFTASDTYQAGLPPTILKRLMKKLSHDKWQTQLDFYTLMFSATERAYAEQYSTTLAPVMADIPLSTLTAGLDYLLQMDLRDILTQIIVPCDIIHGSADTVCPISAGHYLANHLPKAKLHLLKDAGHIPFYTRARDFQLLLKECISCD
jgi:pimeloyl-[acyl-carrier protein] methyl ester esterase